jgi:hypothetical protein
MLLLVFILQLLSVEKHYIVLPNLNQRNVKWSRTGMQAANNNQDDDRAQEFVDAADFFWRKHSKQQPHADCESGYQQVSEPVQKTEQRNISIQWESQRSSMVQSTKMWWQPSGKYQ